MLSTIVVCCIKSSSVSGKDVNILSQTKFRSLRSQGPVVFIIASVYVFPMLAGIVQVNRFVVVNFSPICYDMTLVRCT